MSLCTSCHEELTAIEVFVLHCILYAIKRACIFNDQIKRSDALSARYVFVLIGLCMSSSKQVINGHYLHDQAQQSTATVATTAIFIFWTKVTWKRLFEVLVGFIVIFPVDTCHRPQRTPLHTFKQGFLRQQLSTTQHRRKINRRFDVTDINVSSRSAFGQ